MTAGRAPRRGLSPRQLASALLPLGFLSLLAGLLAGLGRLGWTLPEWSAALALLHGPLMISGFFGTLIGLERASALKLGWVYGGPLLTGLGGLSLIAGVPPAMGAAPIALGSAVFLAAALLILRRQPALFNAVLAAGAACWLAGNLLWLAGRAVPELVLWWSLFLVFTIAGERLELSRVLRPSRRAVAVFAAALAILLGAAIIGLWNDEAAWPIAGAGLVALALWLAHHDIARRTLKLRDGLPRFTAIALLSGYVWLAVAGLCALAQAAVAAPFAYDAMLHALFLGFVFAMVFGHAPIILPAVLQLPVPYRPSFYAPLALLHASLLLRLVGDVLAWQDGRLYGGLLNAAAILLFLATTAFATASALRALPRRRP